MLATTTARRLHSVSAALLVFLLQSPLPSLPFPHPPPIFTALSSPPGFTALGHCCERFVSRPPQQFRNPTIRSQAIAEKVANRILNEARGRMLYATLMTAKLVTAEQIKGESSDDDSNAFFERLTAIGACVRLRHAAAHEIVISASAPSTSWFSVYEGGLETQKLDAAAPLDPHAPPLYTYGANSTGGVFTGELGVLRGLALGDRQVVAQLPSTLLTADRHGLARLVALVPELQAELQLKLIRQESAPLEAILRHPLAASAMHFYQKSEFTAIIRASGQRFTDGANGTLPAASTTPSKAPLPKMPTEVWQFWRDATTFQELVAGSHQDAVLVHERVREAQAIVTSYLSPDRQVRRRRSSAATLMLQRRRSSSAADPLPMLPGVHGIAIPDDVKARTMLRVQNLLQKYETTRRLDNTVFQEAIDAVLVLARQYSIVNFRTSSRFADLRRRIGAHMGESCFADVDAFNEALQRSQTPTPLAC